MFARYRSRYILQPNNYCCGPAALHNASVWQTNTSPEWDTLVSLCDPNHEFGTLPEKLTKVVTQCLNVRAETTVRPVVMKKWLSQGDALILLYARTVDYMEEKEFHYIFVHPYTNSRYMVYNAICPKKTPDYYHLIQAWPEIRTGYLHPDKVQSNGRFQSCPVAWRIPSTK